MQTSLELNVGRPTRTRKHESRTFGYPNDEGQIRFAVACRCGLNVVDLATEEEAREHERQHTDPSYTRPVRAEVLYTKRGEAVTLTCSDVDAYKVLLARSEEILVGRGRRDDFLMSLVDFYAAKGRFSQGQRVWAHKLAQQLTARAEKPATPTTGETFPRLVEMLRTASESLKHPRIVGRFDEGALRINLAGERARFPGSLNVTSEGSFDDRTWYGRIHADGRWEPSKSCPAWVTTRLREFNADPASVAKLQGQKYGACCFCSRELITTESVTAGYGPVCAEKYGLPWG